MPIMPFEAYSPLIVYSYAPLTYSISRQLFESIGRRNSQIHNAGRTVQHSQLSHRGLLSVSWKRLGALQVKDPLSFFALKAFNH
jgi:hypothetical protein